VKEKKKKVHPYLLNMATLKTLLGKLIEKTSCLRENKYINIS